MGPRIREDRGEEGRTKWRLLRVRIGVAGGNEDGFPPPPSRGQAIREDKGGGCGRSGERAVREPLLRWSGEFDIGGAKEGA